MSNESEAREVPNVIAELHGDHLNITCPYCGKIHTHGLGYGHRVAHCYKPMRDNSMGYNLVPPGLVPVDRVAISLPLAQRILAALEEQRNRCMDSGRPASAKHLHALARELREVLPK